LQGLRDILLSGQIEKARSREKIGNLIPKRRGIFSSRVIPGQEAIGPSKYQDYFEWSEPIKLLPRIELLAHAGEGEGAFLMLGCLCRTEVFHALYIMERNSSRCFPILAVEPRKLAIKDFVKRCLKPKLWKRSSTLTKRKPIEESGSKFFNGKSKTHFCWCPLEQKSVMAIIRDLGQFVNLVCLGALRDNSCTMKANFPHERTQISEVWNGTVKGVRNKFDVQAIAIAMATAGRETEALSKKSWASQSLILSPC